jgi:hypothetical protein
MPKYKVEIIIGNGMIKEYVIESDDKPDWSSSGVYYFRETDGDRKTLKFFSFPVNLSIVTLLQEDETIHDANEAEREFISHKVNDLT